MSFTQNKNLEIAARSASVIRSPRDAAIGVATWEGKMLKMFKVKENLERGLNLFYYAAFFIK